MSHRLTHWLAACLLFALAGAAAAADKDCAVIMLHGKWGNPQQVAVFARRLDPPCTPKTLEMPWSQRRDYDVGYPQALQEIAAAVKELRGEGYHHVLLAGHSFGANAVLAYGAEIGDVDGLIALAPGHGPRRMYAQGISRAAVDEARQLVADGKGDQTVTVEDVNQGRRRSERMKASVLLSYFDPHGWGDMPTTTARLKPGVPLLWVVGTGDPLYQFGSAFAFDKAPPNPASRFATVQADHVGTPEAAVSIVQEWIQALLAH